MNCFFALIFELICELRCELLFAFASVFAPAFPPKSEYLFLISLRSNDYYSATAFCRFFFEILPMSKKYRSYEKCKIMRLKVHKIVK